MPVCTVRKRSIDVTNCHYQLIRRSVRRAMWVFMITTLRIQEYIKKDHHEGIITRDDYIATQRLITNSKYGYKGLLPSLHVINTGALCGFVELNPRWSGFSKEDYLDAVQCFEYIDHLPSVSFREKEVQAGEFDLRGYEIVRSQFFRSCNDISVTFSLSDLLFSQQCVQKLNKTATVELLFDPVHHRLAVRPTVTSCQVV